MINVEVRSIAPGTCIWCGKQKEQVIHLAFADKSFSGPTCRADFLKALTMKVASAENGQAAKPTAAVPVSSPTNASSPQK